ncbi:LysR family transcriptional regulator [Saccharothrix variisporea]|uniref:DNA-binding transcriptional LysR family regulator n=1 Tax=Saccharothrix variisporea TaxID=543527 RepID=A0A495X7Q9_9PSEU|nr:LysR family transcriptional regulator [Saccharothrix variisporea]RKT69195.1 DNA-binding transcriptional LysR family regulator [Saccharothrix variisporea]
MKLEIRHIRILLTVIEESSIRRAAQRLGVPQPALSSQLSRIEQTLGHRLFDRSSNGVTLTRHGGRLLPHLRAIDAGMQALEHDDATKPRPHAGVRLGLSSTALMAALESDGKLPTRSAQFALVEGSSGLKALVNRALDFVETTRSSGSSLELPQRLRLADVGDVPIGVVIPPGHSLHDRGRVAVEDLRGQQWVSCMPETELHQELVRFGGRFGFQPDIRYFTASRAALVDMLAKRPMLAAGDPAGAAAVGGRFMPFGQGSALQVVVAWDPVACAPELVDELVVRIRDWYRAPDAIVVEFAES